MKSQQGRTGSHKPFSTAWPVGHLFVFGEASACGLFLSVVVNVVQVKVSVCMCVRRGI